MKLSIELILAIWGALVSTILAVITIVKEYRQRPKILIDSTLAFRPSNEEEDTYGVKVNIKRGDDILTEEAFVEFTIRNAGLLPTQINAVYVEQEFIITQIIASGLPVTLQPNTSVTVKIQPEMIAPVKLNVKESEDYSLDPEEVISIGVFDALGKKHSVNKDNLNKLVESCRKLPLRVGVYKHKKTGNLVIAFQSKDQSALIKK